MVVEIVDDALVARVGRLHAVATPYTEPEAVRVELIPGRGAPLRFHLDGDQADAVVWDGKTFERTDRSRRAAVRDRQLDESTDELAERISASAS